MNRYKTQRIISIPATKLPVVDHAEVVICGGGTAGFIAAVAAARTGVRTILIERGSFLGGALTGTYVSSPGNFADSDGNLVIAGIAWEVIERLEKIGLAIIEPGKYKPQIFPEGVKSVAFDMALEAGVECYLYTMLSDVLLTDNLIQGIVIQNKSGRQVIKGKEFIDCTGDADLSALAGVPFEQLETSNLWQTSVDLLIAHVDPKRVIQWAQENNQGAFSPEMNYEHRAEAIQPMFTLLVPNPTTELTNAGIKHHGPMPTVKLMIDRTISRVQGSVEIDPTDALQLVQAEREGRKRALANLGFLKKTVPGFENAIVVGESHLGVRESRRIIGDYRLTIQDLLSNARFPDVVLLNARALDRHLAGENFELEFITGNHDIPYRSLIPKNVNNLLVAGRCLSCDHESHASLRGAATCMAMGHAAGTAAAMAAMNTGLVRELDIQQLQKKLVEQKTILAPQPPRSINNSRPIDFL